MKSIQVFSEIYPNQLYHINFDGSNRDVEEIVGLGFEVRDQNQNLIISYSEQIPYHKLPTYISPSSCEPLALVKTLSFCHNEGLKKISLKNDSNGLVFTVQKILDLIKHNNVENEVLKNNFSLNNDIYNLIQKFDFIKIKYLPREFNKNADFYSRHTNLILTQLLQTLYPKNLLHLDVQITGKITSIVEKIPFVTSDSQSCYIEESQIISNSIINQTNNIQLDIKKTTKNSSSTSKNKSSSKLKIDTNQKSSVFSLTTQPIETNNIPSVFNKVLNINIIPFKNENAFCIKFFYDNNQGKKNKNQFKTLLVSYGQHDINEAILFALLSITSKDSSLNVFQKYENEILNNFFNINYDKSLFNTFSDNPFIQDTYFRTFIDPLFIKSFKNYLLSSSINGLLKNSLNCLKFIENKTLINITTNQMELFLSKEDIILKEKENHIINASPKISSFA